MPVVGLLVALWPAAATATDEKPELGVAGEEELQLIIAGDAHGWDMLEDKVTGTLIVTVFNPGAEDVTPEFALARKGSSGECAADLGSTLKGGEGESVPAHSHANYTLTFEVDRDCVGVPAALLVTGSPEIATVTGDVASRRDIGVEDYGPPLLAALVAGALFAAITRSKYRDERDRRTPTAEAWSFGGSWLTSISAVTTALAGVLAATGFVSEVLPGIPLGYFFGLSLAFGALIIAAPMVFSIHQVTDEELKKDPNDPAKFVKVKVLRGRLPGLFYGGALTCAGAGGLITMLMVLAVLSNAPVVSKIAVFALLVCTAVVVVRYVAAATRQAVAVSVVKVELSAEDLTNVEEAPPVLVTQSASGFTGSF